MQAAQHAVAVLRGRALPLKGINMNILGGGECIHTVGSNAEHRSLACPTYNQPEELHAVLSRYAMALNVSSA